MPRVSRRSMLQSFGTALAGVAGVVATSGAASAHFQRQREYVDLVYDETRLERYKPYLVTKHLDYKPNALYGWIAESAEHDVHVAVYWAEYDYQDGTLPLNAFISDSHQGDHEPVYVAFDKTTGEIVEVVASVYHWLRGRYYPSELQYATSTQRRPLFKPVNPWHQYVPTDEIGVDPDLEDLGAEKTGLPAWLENGLEGALEPGTAVHPWKMLGSTGRQHWWRDDYGFSLDAQTVTLLLSVSQLPGIDPIGGAEKSDTEAYTSAGG